MFQDLDDEDRRRVLQTAHRRQFGPGEALFHEGDEGTALYILSHGRVAVRSSTPQGDVVTLSVLGPGDVFGELALVRPRHQRTASVVALERVETTTLEREAFEHLRRAHPSVERFLVAVLAARVARLSAHLVEALHVPADKRVLRRLLGLVRLYGEGFLPVTVPLTQDDLASLAGTTRPTANKVLRQMEELGAVRLSRGKIQVLDPGALRARAGS